MWQLLNELGKEPLIVVSDHPRQILLNMRTARVANLKCIDAYLGHGERKDLYLLEAAVDYDSGVDARRVDG